MTLFDKTVTEAVVEVIKPSTILYRPELTKEEMAIILIAVSQSCGIGVNLFRKLRQGVGIAESRSLPEAPRNADGRTIVRQSTITLVENMMK